MAEPKSEVVAEVPAETVEVEVVEVPSTTDLTDADIAAMEGMLPQAATAKPADDTKVVAKEEVVDTKVVQPEPKAEAPVTKETELETAIRQNSELRELLNQMAAGGPVAAAPVAPVVSPTAAVPAAQPVAGPDSIADILKILSPDAIKQFSAAMKEDIPFITKEQLDTIVDKPELLIPILNNVRRQSAQETLSILPTIVATMVATQLQTERMANEFYEQNKDLGQYRDYTKHIFQSIVTDPANKEKGIEDVLTLTAVEVRKRLRLAAPVEQTKPAVKQPKFPAGVTKGARGVKAPASTDVGKTQSDYMTETLAGML